MGQIKKNYSEVPNRQADPNKRAGLEKNATLLAYLLSKSINEQSGIFRLLHEKLRAGWNENLKNLSKLLLGTSKQSHYREVPRWEIFMEQELRFRLDLGRFGNI